MRTTNQHNQESRESQSPTTKWAADSTLFWLFIVALAAIVLSTYSRAGTYNFYLNNTEQGDSANSSPSISVKEKKANKKKIETVPAEEVEDTSDENNDSNQYDALESSDDDMVRRKKKLNQGVTAKKDPSLYLPEEPKFQRWRIALSLQYSRETNVERSYWTVVDGLNSSSGINVNEYTDISRFPLLELGFYFSRYFAVNLGLGRTSALEVELIPISTPDQTFEWAVMTGLTAPNGRMAGVSATMDDNFLWHVGTRLNAQITPFGGLTTSIRWAPRVQEIYPSEQRSVYDSFSIGAGLFIRF